MSQVTFDACYALLPLSFLIKVDRYPQVLDTGHAGDACDVTLLVLRKYLGLGLVQPQIPHFTEAIELLYGLGHLRLGVGQDEHVIRKGQEIASPYHLFELLRSA